MTTCKRVPSRTAVQQERTEQRTERAEIEKRAWRKLKPYLGAWPEYVLNPERNPYGCVEPVVGKLLSRWNRWSRGLSDKALLQSQRQLFFGHLKACHRCRESLDEHGWIAFFMRLIVTELTPEEYAAIRGFFTGSTHP